MLFSIANVNIQRFSSFDEKLIELLFSPTPTSTLDVQYTTLKLLPSTLGSGVLVYLAAGQVQGSVLVVIQQRQVSLGPVKEDGCTTGGESLGCHDRHPNPINCGQQLRFHDSLELGA